MPSARKLQNYIRPSLGRGLGVGLLLFFLFVSCTVDLPSYVISEGRMERILYDYHLAQSMAESQEGDAEANRYLYVQKVFEKHHITEAQFDTSMVWYSGHASHLEDIYQRLDTRLERESNAAGLNISEVEQYSRYTSEGDTANIWKGREIFFLHGNREGNLYTVVIPADSTYRPGDSFMFHTTNRFIVQDSQREAYILMQVTYTNDSVASATTLVGGDNDISLHIGREMVRKSDTIRSVSCTFYFAFDEHADDAFRLWAVSRPVLLRYHAQVGDSVAIVADADTLEADTSRSVSEQMRHRRVSPEEFRDNQDIDRKIHVVQKRQVVLPSEPKRKKVIKPRR